MPAEYIIAGTDQESGKCQKNNRACGICSHSSPLTEHHLSLHHIRYEGIVKGITVPDLGVPSPSSYSNLERIGLCHSISGEDLTALISGSKGFVEFFSRYWNFNNHEVATRLS
ncbi:hypothetical protein RJ53_04585 [Methanocalculus chunghsingensis]|uniref:Uncharacterized protein n=1 Tax=Methanocalculus chunghsingensis TaxID=156457 RepID=A0A8J7W6X4_9EURY|nr:hypothetical protein [Methanocalculus chunghsingensis]